MKTAFLVTFGLIALGSIALVASMGVDYYRLGRGLHPAACLGVCAMLGLAYAWLVWAISKDYE